MLVLKEEGEVLVDQTMRSTFQAERLGRRVQSPDSFSIQLHETRLRSLRMPHVYIRGLTVAISLVCHGIALLFLLVPLNTSSISLRSRPDALLLLAICIVVSLVLFITRRDVVVAPLLVSRLVLVLLIGIPLGPAMPVKLALWSSLVLEACGYLGRHARLPAAAAIIIIVLLFQHPFKVWGESVLSPPLPLVVAACAWLLGITAVACSLHRFIDMIIDERRTASRLDQAVRQLTEANLGFQKVASAVREQSAEDERKRISREIHDSIGYALTNLIMMMEAAIRLAPEEDIRLRDLLARAREEAQLGLNETRRALRMLRAITQDEVRALSAIQRLVTIFRQSTGVEVQVNYCNAPQSFGMEADQTIYRMVQEGLTNAFHHGRATLIRLQFWQEPNAIRVILWDNGSGGEDVTEGIGLSGMRERIEHVGGTLRFGRVVNGFELSAWIPLECI